MTLQALSVLASLAFSGGICGLCRALYRSLPIQRRLQRTATRMDQQLRYLQLPLQAATVLRAQATVAFALLALCALHASAFPLALLPLAAVVPGSMLERRTAQRTTRIEEQLDTWLLSLSNALRANPSLGEAIAASAQLMNDPLRGELRLVLREHRLGTPLDRALRSMADRVDSPVIGSAMVALRIARNAGGNLNQTLETTAATLREMARLEGVVRTKTAEGRAQSAVIAAVPAGMFGLLHILDPEMVEPLVETTMGHLLLAVASALWLAALLLARRIVAVDI